MQVVLRPGCGQASPRKEAALLEAESPLVGRGGGWCRLLLVSMHFPNWEVKPVPPGDEELALEIGGSTSEPQRDGVGVGGSSAGGVGDCPLISLPLGRGAGSQGLA